MYQIFQQTANSVQFSDIVNVYVNKEQNSPSTLRKILGHDGRLSEKHYISNHPIKPPAQRKSDLWLPKNVSAAIDMHVREISYSSYKTLTDFIYKLNEVCENDLQRARYFEIKLFRKLIIVFDSKIYKIGLSLNIY